MRRLLLSACLLSVLPAVAHDALPTAAQPDGWSYPHACCSSVDCRRVPADWIDENSHPGYRIVPTGEVIEMSDTRIRQSPDGEFHWCSVAGANDSRTICLFVPPRGF